MVISELALGLFINFLYDSFKSIPQYISDTSSKVYDKAIEEFSNKNYKLTGIQIDTFFRQKNVEKAIKKYLKNPDKLDCSNILINEFFELFSEEDFSREDADLILNSFFEIIDAEIEKEPELRDYLILNLVKKTDKTTQETNQEVKELSKDVKEISHKVKKIHEVINGGRENQDKKESGVDFEKALEKYLNKIIDDNENKEINEIYTELSAKEILPVTLKFRETESDIPREYEVLELVEKEEKLIISGESGSGKTTTLRWLNYILAKSYLEGKNEKIPLYIELNSYINEERFIKKPFDAYVAMKAKKNGISENTLETILKEKAIILLDGFDLLSPTDEFYPYDKISNFITDYNNCRFVISSRPGFFESIKSFKVSELEKLTDEKIEIFINRYVSSEELADTLKDEILSNEQLKSILSNPMMLFIAIKIATGKKDESGDLLPSNRSELYEAFISTLFNHQNDKGKRLHANRIQIENALIDLYFKLQCRNEVSCKCSEALKFVKKSSEDPLFKEISPQLILEDCSNLGILSKNDNHVSYGIHQSFQEYFVAIKLKELFENGYDISEAFSHPKWEEVVIFTSEMLDLDFIDEFIDSMLSKGELFLASKCVNKASEKIKEKLCALLADKMDSKHELEKINSIESLERTGTTGISIIAEALKDKDSYVRWSAAEALGNIKSDTAVQLLINALKDEDKDVRRNAAYALGNTSSEEVTKHLLSVLSNKNEDKDVRRNAAHALGNTSSEEVAKYLFSILNDKNEHKDVRRDVAYVLGIIEVEGSVEQLITLLKDKHEEKDVRRSAVEALENINSEEVMKLLINILKDKHEDKDVRLSAIEALKNINSTEAMKPLINILKDKHKDKDVWENVAYTLGIMKVEEAVEYLIIVLEDKDEDKHVRQSVADTLGIIEMKRDIEPLIRILKDKHEDKDVRWSVAEALGNINSAEATMPLINILKDKHEDKDVRWSVANALGNINSAEATMPLINILKDKHEDKDVWESVALTLGIMKVKEAAELLINILKDKHEETDVRLTAAEALGNIQDKVAVEPLINILKNKNEEIYLRTSAADALGKIKAENSVQPLVTVLDDESEDMRWRAASALGNLKYDTAVQPLINALKDEDKYVQESAADALGKICTVKNKKQLEDLLESDHEFLANTAFEILYEIEKEEKSKLILFTDLKKRSEIVTKYIIFVSSVQKELENERLTIQDLVGNDLFLSAHYTSLLYEYEPAYPEKTLDGCLNALNSCQVYLLIVGAKYGTLVGEISITHTEYRYAKEKNLPILVFIKGERNIEREPGTEALLREIESDDFKYKRFKNVIELKNEVNESLKKLLRDEDKFLKS